MAGPATAYQTGDHSSRPANGAGCVLYSCTDHNLVYLDNGSSWSTLITLTSGMSNPMTTAGDIVYSSDGSGTPARLGVGSDDDVLTLASGVPSWAAPSGGSGLSTGSSFPVSPSTGDRYRRSDIDYMVFFYDGTRWLSEEVFFALNEFGGISADTTRGAAFYSLRATYDLYLIRTEVRAYVATTNDGSHYWSIQTGTANAATTTTVRQTCSTSGNSPDVYVAEEDTTGVAVTAANALIGNHKAVKTGSPGTLYASVTTYYRVIAT